MTPEQLQKAAAPLRAARARQVVGRLDYLRGVGRLKGQVTQVDLAQALGITQSAVSQALREEAKLPRVPEGFHGGDPEEIIQRFTAGYLTREQVIDELARWPYAPDIPLDGPLDDLLIDTPGSFDVVADALSSGQLPGDVYDAILDRLETRIDPAS